MTESNCVFCKIASGQIPAVKLLEDEAAIAFADLNPQAPTHVLVIPRRHVQSLAHVEDADFGEVGKVMHLAARVARKLGVAEGGYRVVLNSGKDAGQTVEHLHAHVLGGRQMAWPPG